MDTTQDYNIQIEQSLISVYMVFPEKMDEMPEMRKEYFQGKNESAIYQSIKDIRNAGGYINPITVSEKSGVDIKYIIEIVKIDSSQLFAKEYAGYIYEKGKERYIKNKIKDACDKSEKDKSFNLKEAINEIESEEEQSEETKDFKEEALKSLEWKMNHANETSGIITGIKDFDETINGFNKGCLYICAGRSSMGKSAFMTSAISEIEKKNKVGIISLEMTGKELVNRIGAIRTDIPYWVIDRGKTNSYQFEKYAKELEKIKKLIIDDKGGMDCQMVCSKIRNFVKTQKCEIVFIDHIGLIQIDDAKNIAHAVGKITAALKTIAKEMNIPIVALCQVNRGVEKEKKDKRPHLSDLRDSGRIEEDADCVFFLFRQDYYNAQEKITRYENAEIIVAKNRNGACKIIGCQFDNQLMKFYEEAV